MLNQMNAAQQRAFRVACDYADRSMDPDTGLLVYGPDQPAPRECVYAALTFLLTQDPPTGRTSQADSGADAQPRGRL